MGEIAIHPERNFSHEKIPDRIHPVSIDQTIRLHHILKGFGHLLPFDRPPAMGKYHFRRRQANGLQHGRPVDGVGGEDILADQMSRLRPKSGEEIFLESHNQSH